LAPKIVTLPIRQSQFHYCFFIHLILILAGCSPHSSAASSIDSAGDKEILIFDKFETVRKVVDIVFFSVDGKKHTLSEYGGSLLIVNIWATWCAPCVAEMPSLDRLAQTHPEIQVLAISQDKAGPIVIPKFFKRYKLKNLVQLYDSTGLSQQRLGVSILPTSLIVNERGEIIAELVGATDWLKKSTVAELKSFRSR